MRKLDEMILVTVLMCIYGVYETYGVLLPKVYYKGVLLPEATLTLTDIEPRFKVAVERALDQVDAPNIIAVIRAYVHPDDGQLRFANIGTTAEIRKYLLLEDGSLKVLAHGQQRFHLRHHWIDLDGAPCADVEIITEDLPLRTPRDAFGQLASVINVYNHNISHQVPSDASHYKHVSCYEDNESEYFPDTSFENELSPTKMQMHVSAINCCSKYAVTDKLTSDDYQAGESRHHPGRTSPDDSGVLSQCKSSGGSRSDSACQCTRNQSVLGKKSHNLVGWKKELAAIESKWLFRTPRSFLPHWVYRMYDSYSLAQRAAVMWKQIIRVPNIDVELVKKPDIFSFYVASKIPVSEPLRQELLEIDGISYRLRREIELLECFDLVRCKTCQSGIAKRSEMLVMSSNGPLGADVNPHGYVNEMMKFDTANGLALIGSSAEEGSLFPGYSWTSAVCASCESHMGWLFTGTDKKLKLKPFWGIRNIKVVDKIS